MMTTENSRVDALTDEQILAFAARMSIGSREYYKFGDRRMIAFARTILAAPPVEQPAAAPIHSDDAAVDMFAATMKAKLDDARAKGRSGWAQCDPADLSRMLREHVEKGDPRDVANFCMFLWALGKHITRPAPADERAAFEAWWRAGGGYREDKDIAWCAWRARANHDGT